MGVLSEQQVIEEYFKLHDIRYDDLVREHQESRGLQVLKPNDLVLLENSERLGDKVSTRPVKSFDRFSYRGGDNIDLFTFKEWFSESGTIMLFMSYIILGYNTTTKDIFNLAYIFLNKKEFVLNYRCSDNTSYRIL